MKKTNAGERKRTVTLVIGTATGEILDGLVAGFEARNPGCTCTWTDICGTHLDNGLTVAAVVARLLPSNARARHYD